MSEKFLTNPVVITPRLGKTQFSETEAAAELGVTVEALRTLIRQHIVGSDEAEARSLPLTSFQPSDLVLLRILCTMQAGALG